MTKEAKQSTDLAIAANMFSSQSATTTVSVQKIPLVHCRGDGNQTPNILYAKWAHCHCTTHTHELYVTQ